MNDTRSRGKPHHNRNPLRYHNLVDMFISLSYAVPQSVGATLNTRHRIPAISPPCRLDRRRSA